MSREVWTVEAKTSEIAWTAGQGFPFKNLAENHMRELNAMYQEIGVTLRVVRYIPADDEPSFGEDPALFDMPGDES